MTLSGWDHIRGTIPGVDCTCYVTLHDGFKVLSLTIDWIATGTRRICICKAELAKENTEDLYLQGKVW